MEICHGKQSISDKHQGGVVALGNFDGVHRGHQILLTTARDMSKDQNIPFGVMSFEPHPRSFFGKDNLFRLSPFNIKPYLFQALGADFVKIYDFDTSFAALTAREFIEKTLIEHLGVHTVVCGYDFHFGKGREGNADKLRQIGEELGFSVEVVPVQNSDKKDRIFSSSNIREDLRAGDVCSAAHDLGRWWSMRGIVEKGEGQGKFLGFPTANIPLDSSCALKPGSYAARLRLFGQEEGAVIDGAAYVGTKPTFGEFNPRLEIFLFDFDADLYGRDVLVEFISYLREDEKFNNAEDLAAQMKKDCTKAADILKSLHQNGDPMSVYEMGRFFTP